MPKISQLTEAPTVSDQDMMPAVDGGTTKKAKVRTLLNVVNGTATTTDATPTVLVSYAMADSHLQSMRLLIKVQTATANKWAVFEVKADYYKTGGVITQVAAPTVTIIGRSDVGIQVAVAPNANASVDVTVTGLALTTLTWSYMDQVL